MKDFGPKVSEKIICSESLLSVFCFINSVQSNILSTPLVEYSTDEEEFECRIEPDCVPISEPDREGGRGVHALTGSLSNTITVPLATQAEYSTDEDEFNGCDKVEVRLYDHARNPDKVPIKRKNTAYRNLSTTVPASRTHQGYNLAYFNLWWSRMGVEARKEERLRLAIEEEESRNSRRKRK